ncbi:MAG TPA: GTP 3',8-cyclase MoaA [Anaeromyxobacter sp.]
MTERAAGSQPSRALEDALGRRLHYLRLSVTDRCNFRCVYCLPDGCGAAAGPAPLSLAEIRRLVRGFADLGFWKVRLTGGEPTMRADIARVVREVASTPGVRKVGLTTNGYRLVSLAAEFRHAGLASINVSLDSLDPERFRELTGSRGPDRIVAGIEAALAAGIPVVKLNVVLLRGLGEGEIARFLEWTRAVPLRIRFIELMETAENRAFFARARLEAGAVRRLLEERGWARLARTGLDGPAVEYAHPGHAGLAGLISAYEEGFCEGCNRLRVTSQGGLRLCLFGEEEVSLRPFLQRDGDREALIERVRSAVARKPSSHLLQLGRCGSTPHLAATGG